jgi:prepilin-type N-terminal cleavage/methylation domain-containing protein
MKRFPLRPRSNKYRAGFTLVELLVVMAIIAILAATVSVAASSAINSANRTKAANMAHQLGGAVMNYYSEYGVYPAASGVTIDSYYQTQANWQPMIVALCGGIDPGNPSAGQYGTQTISNSRQIPFLTLSKSDLDTGTPAVVKTPFKISGATSYYYMAVDTDYSNVVGDSGTAPPDFSSAASGATTIPGNKAIAGGVAVWANCDPNTSGATTRPNFWVHTY